MLVHLVALASLSPEVAAKAKHSVCRTSPLVESDEIAPSKIVLDRTVEVKLLVFVWIETSSRLEVDVKGRY